MGSEDEDTATAILYPRPLHEMALLWNKKDKIEPSPIQKFRESGQFDIQPAFWLGTRNQKNS